jgi:CHAT domain-containing protein
MTDATALGNIRAARAELDAVIDEIRSVPGYEDFLAGPTFDDVATQAEVCPLVYLAAAEPGGVALVVRGTAVAHVPLDGLTAAALQERTMAHFSAYTSYRLAPAAARSQWTRSLNDITSWLWDEVMGPVLSSTADASDLVLIAGGLLGLLPLHAAWTSDPTRPTGRRYALDTVTITYAPNARSLRAARRLAAEVGASRLLAVAEPRPVRGAPLPMAHLEAATAVRAFVNAHATLHGGEATFLAFESEAPKADVLHLACHGFANLASPLESGLLLAGGTVTLRRLMELRLRVRLAVLSACETALPGTDLPDEVVALPTGLLQAGVAGIVASQWSVPDRATAMLMAEFYRCWRQEHRTPPNALGSAQRWLRDTTNEEKASIITATLDDEAALLPRPVALEFLSRLNLSQPDSHSHAGIHNWAGFTYVGT